MTVPPTVTVSDRPEAKRFVAHADGELVGYIEYIPLPGKIIATHTEVLEQYQGQGMGSEIIAGMVAQLRADGRLLQPLCPYVTAWLRRHPNESDVVDPASPQ